MEISSTKKLLEASKLMTVIIMPQMVSDEVLKAVVCRMLTISDG